MSEAVDAVARSDKDDNTTADDIVSLLPVNSGNLGEAEETDGPEPGAIGFAVLQRQDGDM